MICFPNAKINLGLNVLSKRDDGFHQVETVLYPIPLYDVLEFIESDVFEIFYHGIPIKIPFEEEILYKTWKKLNHEFNILPVEIHLIKNIPPGSGLGGASSDAANFLKAVNQYFSLGLEKSKLINIARAIGSDVPFFIENRPSFAFNRGEKTEIIDLSLKGKYLLLVSPQIEIVTSNAYSRISPNPGIKSIKEIIKNSFDCWKNLLINDFEKPIFKIYPELAEIKTLLYDQGAIFASMTGTGSSVFGIFNKPPSYSEIENKYLTSLFPLN